MRAESVVAFTGAGVSAESGVPTFRGNDGIWNKFRPEDLASIDGFVKNPALVWEWYKARKQIMAEVEPNSAHRALAAMQECFKSMVIVTQNIDNLHRRAGSRTVYELHGNIEHNYCVSCGARYSNMEVLEEEGVPVCRKILRGAKGERQCGGVIRPDVVWFGETLPREEWNGAVRALEGADVVLTIGTSGVVYPAASLPSIARKHGAYVAEINPESTLLTPEADEFVKGPAGTIVPALLEILRETGVYSRS